MHIFKRFRTFSVVTDNADGAMYLIRMHGWGAADRVIATLKKWELAQKKRQFNAERWKFIEDFQQS